MKLRCLPDHTVLSAFAALAAVVAAAVLPGPAHAQRRDPDSTPVVMCTGQPIPDGYVVVATGRSPECPRFYDSIDPNTFSVVRPQETVAVCSRLTPGIPGYVVTGRRRAPDCPGFYDTDEPNLTAYQRVSRGRWGRGDGPRDEPAVALAPLEPGDRVLLHRLRTAEARLQVDEPTHQPWTGTLRQGQTATTRLELQPGESYALVAACDGDCNDVDVRVTTPSAAGDRVLADDLGPEATAAVRIPSTFPPRLDVTVVMVQCGTAECGFAVAVHHAPATVPVQRPSAPRPLPPTAPRP